MPSELVKRMRAKYPTEYSDLSDAELESKVLAKYPEYKDLVSAEPDSAAPTETPEPQQHIAPATTAAAYGAQSVLPRALPAVTKAATYVAETPMAQRAIGATVSAAMGGGTKTDMALEALLGERLSGFVGLGAQKLAQLTAASRATVGRAANGQFTKLVPKARVLPKLGQMVGMITSEGDALSNLNSPEQVDLLNKAMHR